jgi:hypothetical protein
LPGDISYCLSGEGLGRRERNERIRHGRGTAQDRFISGLKAHNRQRWVPNIYSMVTWVHKRRDGLKYTSSQNILATIA